MNDLIDRQAAIDEEVLRAWDVIRIVGDARKNTAQTCTGKAQDIAIDQKRKNSIRGIIKNGEETKQKQTVYVLYVGRSHVCTDQNVMSVISGKNGMTGRNMTGAESGGKRQASVTFAAMM